MSRKVDETSRRYLLFRWGERVSGASETVIKLIRLWCGNGLQGIGLEEELKADKDWINEFHRAAKQGDLDKVMYFLKRGMDVDVRNKAS